MGYEQYSIRIETCENGYKVSVPDFAAIKKKQAAAKKNGNSDSCYIGGDDCMDSFVAKDTAEVLTLVNKSLNDMPESEFDKAFGEAADAKGK